MHAMFLICRLTSHGHIRKMPFDLKGENLSPFITTMPSLLVIDCVEEKKERL